MSRQSCLTAEELTAFNLGDLPEAVLDELAEHLESCPRCEAAARALDAVSDPTVAAYRQSALAGPLSEPAAPPQRVGDYEILEEIGRGGMGVVYKARHQQLQRTVALKMLLGGSFVTSRERARFRIEAEAVARLRHANIVRIYEVGEHDIGDGVPRPFFTLEFAAGGNLSSRLAGRPQPPRQAAAWLKSLAGAAHYAHQQGIVHRDLKPSNVLLSEDGEPTICDFGVAKLLTGSDIKTRSGTLLGTAEYMAPEQAAESEQVGPPADIYALGALFYTMLTGRPPFQGTSTLHVLEQVRSQEPLPPRRLVSHLPADLETICLKCLRKEAARRYASAEELADDLERFLEGRPIRARPVGRLERVGKWVRRRPGVAGLLAAVIALAAVGAVLVIGLWRGAKAEAKAEAEAKRLAQENEKEHAKARTESARLLAGVTLNRGVSLCAQGEIEQGLLHLSRALERAVAAKSADTERVARLNLSAWRRRLVNQRAALHHKGWVWALAFSPDGQTVLTGGSDGLAKRWDARTGQPIGKALAHVNPVWAVAFSPDGRTILTGSGRDTKHEGEVRLWDAASSAPLCPSLPQPDEIHTVSFHADGRRFVTACDEEVRLWHLEEGKPLSVLLPHPKPARRIASLQPRLWTTFAPDGRSVLTWGEDGTVRRWDSSSGEARGELVRHDGPILTLIFSPDGKTILTGSYDGTARLWDAATGRQRGPALFHHGRVLAVAFTSDGELIATGGAIEEEDANTHQRLATAGEVRLWRAATGERIGEPIWHPQPVWALAFRPGSRQLLSGSRDRSARFFDAAGDVLLGKPLDHEGTVASVLFRGDGKLALTASAGGDHSAHARLWEPPAEVDCDLPDMPLRFGQTWEGVQCFTPDREGLLTLIGRTARVYNVATGQLAGPILEDTETLRNGIFSADSQTLLTVSEKNGVSVWDWRHGRRLGGCRPKSTVLGMAFNSSARTVILLGADQTIQVWDMAAAQFTTTPQGRPRFVFERAMLSLDGQSVFLLDDAGPIRLWDIGGDRLLRSWKAPGPVRSIDRLGDRLVAVTGEGDRLARVWDLDRGRPFSAPLSDLTGSIRDIVLSADGGKILTGSWDRKFAVLWDAPTGKAIGPPIAHSDAVKVVAFSPDGRRMLSCSVDRHVRSAVVPAPLPGDVEQIRCWIEALTGMMLDAQDVVWTLDADAVRQRWARLRELGGAPDGAEPP